jgi:thiosulfate reductase cytochrome b subunit
VEIINKHPLWLRVLHWLGFPCIAMMVWSGLMIYWANREYTPFIPDSLYRVLQIDHRLAEGMAIHFTLGWLVVLVGTTYLFFTFASGHWRELLPDRDAARKLVPTVLSEIGIGHPVPKTGKFNSAQRFAYTGLIFLMILELLSGFAIYKPVQLLWLSSLMGGHKVAHWIHFMGMVGIILFFIIHVIQVIRSGWNGFRSMIAGFEVKE